MKGAIISLGTKRPDPTLATLMFVGVGIAAAIVIALLACHHYKKIKTRLRAKDADEN